MTEPNPNPLPARELIEAVQGAVIEVGMSVTESQAVDLLDALRAEGWIVQPAPVPGVPVNALPDAPPAPGAPDPAPAGNQVDW